MKKISIIFFLSLFMQLIIAQQVPNVINSWLGNSNPDENTFMPQGLEGMCVSNDGIVYSNVGWEEGGGNFTEIKTNGDVIHGEASHGWGAGGGADAACNSTYVYFSMYMGNEGGGLVDAARWPVAGKQWLGVSRRLKSNIKQGASFAGGKGWPAASMLVVLEYDEGTMNPWIQGLYATETELFVSIDELNLVKVYDANTMVFKREFAINSPFQIAVDSYGKLWIAEGHDATIIKRYNSTDGTLLPEAINLENGSFVGDFCIDKNDRLLIGDVGKREQVLIYTNINTSPELTSTFGNLYGIHSGVSGKHEPLKFQQIRGIGTDDNGNIYIGNTQWHTGGQGAMVEKYNMSSGAMAWKKYCVMFVDAMGIDAATDGADVYGKVEHFKVDYNTTVGQDGNYTAYTIDRYKYPSDPRLWEQFASVQVKNIKGQKFLAMSSMNGGLGAIFRFNPATDGEIAIPCIVFGSGVNPKYPGSTNNSWMWRDLNANGQMETGEYTEQERYFIDGGYGAHMDDNGDIWQAGWQNILHTKCLGLDANNIPLYNGSYNKIPVPAPLEQVKRVYYDVKLDRMYLAGGTTTQPTVDSWQSMGRTINRYDNWSTGNRTASVPELVLPAVTTNGFTVPISFKIVDEYIFVGFLGGEATIPRLQLNIYKVSDNSQIGYIRAPWTGVGLFDIIQSIDAYKRNNGEYVIVTEEDGRNKNVLYRWCSSGSCTETTNQLFTNTNYLKFASTASNQQLAITSNVAWTITGAPAWITLSKASGSGNDNVSFNASANAGAASRTATITVTAGAVTKTITVFQDINDAAAPSNVTGMTATLVTPFSFTLNWDASTDNVMVTGYEVSKNGVVVATKSGLNIPFEDLAPNTSFTMLVKSIDAAGNKSSGTTLVVNTLSVTYPYITARDHANFEIEQRAFDGTDWTTWMDWASTTWIQIQYAAPVIYNQYVIYNSSNVDRKFDPKAWTLQASNDGKNYTIVSTQSNQMWSTAVSLKTFYFNNTTAYKYYRFNFTETRQEAAIMIGEIIFANGTIVDSENPTAPTGLTASLITTNSVTLNWLISADNVGVTSYEVFKDGVSVGTSATSSLLVNNLSCNTSYKYTVKAKDSSGNLSAASSEISVLSAPCPEVIAPSIPLNLAASAITQTSFSLSWSASTDNVGVTGYEIFKGGISVGTTTSTTMSITGLTCNSSYAMTVKARDAAGNWSDASVAINATTLACANTDMNIVNENAKISIYPIPATDVLNFNNLPSEKIVFEIFSMEGKAIKSGSIMGKSITIDELQKGMYFIKIISEKNNDVFRFVKE